MKYRFILILWFSSLFYGEALQAQERQYLGHETDGTTLKILVSDGHYRVLPYNSHILETSFIPTGDSFDPNSHAVVLKPETVKMELQEEDNLLQWTSEGIGLEVVKSPFRLRYVFKEQFLLCEKAGYFKSDSMEAIGFGLDSAEVLYGGGARALGMNRRGYNLKLYNKAHYGYETHSELMNFTMPIVLSSKRYLLHFDNAPIGWLDLDSQGNNTLTYHSISGRMTYQVVAGEAWPDITNHYTRLTGRQPMPPRWAFGNFSSRFGYHSEKETRETVERFWNDSIPLDAVVIDIYWFGPDIFGHMGNLEFFTDSFPTPYKMMADFIDRGVQTILVTEPFILTTSNRWKEAKKNKILALNSRGKPYTYDFYFGNTGLIDLYDENARTWFWDIYKHFTKKGVGGWWGDLGEPEVHPSDLLHATGTADEVHNIYGHDWARLIYEGYEKDFPDQRPFILMRAGYSGSQRFGMIPWSGDVLRSWGGLKPQTEIALQMGMQGMGYMHSDLGGFGEGEVFDPKLYTRWLQYGVFTPLFRPHAQEHIPAEPVFHDDNTKALAKKSIELRYSMLPYNYSLAFENSRTGMPMMRPVFFEEPDNKEALIESDVYLWGDHFLIAPVTDSAAVEKEVYFPAQSNWIDFYSGTVYKGGQSRVLPLDESHIPVFVRGGSLIPLVDPVQSTQNYNTEELVLHFYYDGSVPLSSYRLYDDDGITPQAYEKGLFEIVEFRTELYKNTFRVTMHSKPGAHYTAPDRKVRLVMHNLPLEPETASDAAARSGAAWNGDKKTVTVDLPLEGGNGNRYVFELPGPSTGKQADPGIQE